MLRENIPYSIPPTCQTPERLAGKTWDRIDLDDFACTPNIQSVEIKTNGVEGKNVTMSCYVDGVPDPNVRWIVKNRIIANLSGNGETVARPSIMSSSSSTTTSSQGRKAYVVNFIRNSSNLTILQVEMQDAGVYTCTAENKAGRVEASMTLAVSRKPPEAPLGVKIILLCVTIALLFVIGSSFAAVCFCTKRKKGKLKLWKSSSAPGSDSYEKIEMKRTKPDMHCGRRGIDNNSSSIGGAGAGEYLCTENGGIAVVNATTTASVVLKRNGDYRTVPTEDDEDNNDTTTSFSITQTHKKQKQHHHKIEYSKAASKGRAGGAGNSLIDKNTDLHIGRLIDLG
uniref:Ig-like domain-containing protein n=1 Tax=Megaselia scalaris TaxID=36166 RepID=T1GF39_MEGSC